MSWLNNGSKTLVTVAGMWCLAWLCVATWYKPNGNKASYVDPVLAALGRYRARLGGAS